MNPLIASAHARVAPLLLASWLGGCAATSIDRDDSVLDAGLDPGTEIVRTDAGRGDSGPRASGGERDGGAQVTDTTTRGTADAGAAGGKAMKCGDVEAADHPAFAAIKKLATTDDEVRVLVYGQSISEQAWWQKTKAWLEETYPNGKLVMEEHARGGCSSQCLIGHQPWFSDGQQYNRLPQDVFAWKPDLVIFHVYGDHNDYGYIMEGLQTGCAAFDDYKTFDGQSVPQVRCTDAQRALSEGYRAPEVLVQGDFVNPYTALPESCPAGSSPESKFTCFMNNEVLPKLADEHGYGLQDNFHEWGTYARENGLDLYSLMNPDKTHLAEPAGTDVMFALTIPHLCYEE